MRLRVEYEYLKIMHDVVKFLRIWCIGGAICAVNEEEIESWVDLCLGSLEGFFCLGGCVLVL